jgi:hypothetical protein
LPKYSGEIFIDRLDRFESRFFGFATGPLTVAILIVIF